MRDADYLLVGGGIASVTAARSLRGEDASASIAILCGEPVLPYQRPPLSQEFLIGTEQAATITLHDAAFYASQRIDVVLGARAERLDPAKRIVRASNGAAFRYRKLLIATGATAKMPALPGVELDGVHVLHTIAQAQTLKDAAAHARRATVLGGGFLGVEIAATLQALGLQVTLVEHEPHLMPTLRAPALASHFDALCKARGIDVLTSREVRRVLGAQRVEAVETSDGETRPCDLFVAAVGVTPNCGWLEGSGLALGDGIEVDAFLQTADPNVFAAGDVAHFDDPIFGVRRRIEHWDNAVRQGKIAARNMLGHRLPYRDVSIFYGSVFGLSYNLLGYQAGVTETIERGSFDDRSYALLYLADDVLRAAFTIDRPAVEIAALNDAIKLRVNVAAQKAKLSDPNFPLDKLPVQTMLILQGGGALGAFECGAVKALEQHGVRPDVISAVSIGAFNGAIVASHPKGAAKALEAFWRDLSIALPSLYGSPWHQAWLSAYVLSFGVPSFLKPQWSRLGFGIDQLRAKWTSFFDATSIEKLVTRYVDFDSLGTSPTRLLISAVDVETGEPRIFDSYVDRLSPAHLLASGSLPPGMPWTVVDGRPYWDGGVISNSPLDLVIERCGQIGGRVFIIDLFSGTKTLPTNLVEVMLRREEITYMDRVRNDLRFEEYASDFGDLVDGILAHVDEQTANEIRQQPLYIRLMGNRAALDIARITLNRDGQLSFIEDYDFSSDAIAQLQKQGYDAALVALANGRANRRRKHRGA
ncbi:FAD-dependent oxidoreductase [Burkholderia oklahomensis]|uniref:Pyridine nucleotide-disulfide oxidoreductase family protein n=1 Tax=Burkholderia oklahomensis TaxID=342113 RepID=A0AAI8FSF3_9BURK|nr:FAD-dependent oxidoreductase [Burkholderia oklahomensis]AIO71000.1 pyridine nucleotide-disulfide oxidoreductase family protein [Burkholderia oklahomensis]AJX36178.1 pyridine nucleotide-disulfide oxidoreductase family protein [Burkholderia oklahomensis C6786]AOI40377.1 pyridine nucleotide-disulfide oxidoreductase [Burkholderia oklahomensis EO147]AOI50006.1 pyridine nucleotide-disulfide oxidoreductase [Burkholderia oklahomensis C6786]KUY52983.1 pyridine nucleotide-disulfide oxidoreductase [Bu